MADVKSKEARSFNMSRIRGKDTKPEFLIRRWLHRQGYRYRLHVRGLPGKPDLVLPKYKTVIFINGCFWHGHSGCKKFKWPSTNREFWREKITGNINRDKYYYGVLQNLGWNVLIIWECEVNHLTKESLTLIKKSFDKPK